MPEEMSQHLPLIPNLAHIINIARRHVADHRNVIDTIMTEVTIVTARFSNVMGPIAEVENTQSGEKAVIAALRFAAMEKAMQHAVEEAEKIWLEYNAEVDKNTTLFNLLWAVKGKNEELDSESQRLLNRFLMRYTDCGHGSLDNDGIQEWHSTNQEIEKLCTQFNRNLREFDGNTCGIFFTDDELEGIPQYELEDCQIGLDGKRRMPLRWDQYVSVLRFARNSETRKRFQLAWGQRLPENIYLFKRIVLLRHKNARLRGYKTHAASRLPYRMAVSTEWVDSLLEELSVAMIAEGKKRFELIERTKTRNTPTNDITESHNMKSWDVAYYNRILNEESASVNQEKIMEYFPFHHTFKTLLELFATYLQLRFEKLPAEQLDGHIWCPDVEVWRLWDERPEAKGMFIGYLYADLLGRPHKYKGIQAVNLQPGYLKSDGTRVFPVSTLMCNFSARILNGCMLLKHSQVVTLFHELGHCTHDLLARTRYAKFHGYEVCVEFGEAIATMLENWCWMKDVLKDICCHFTALDLKYEEAWVKENPNVPIPRAEIPDELLEGLIETRRDSRLDRCLSQLCDAKFDIAVHNPSTGKALAELDEVKLYVDLYERFYFTRRPEPCYLHTTFSHLVSGYDAGYYAYICASVFAQDIFEKVFAKDYQCKTSWNRFRTELLEHGGSRDERVMLEKLLGSVPSTFALLRGLNIPYSATETLPK
ncbi:peptidase family M3 [Pochonia chlamydosporia 170]|uniref:Peptidase family M3 n=1 Tax=Pochonia chlamydosporia 170 TaxID=1380566 RepID=A0A179EWP2_METCM|nr:peptidase family M3 [Pochonia chlamydosporia 170]XP_022283876.1 peptidase family M3 [Pochonia chlamydosporia 170]OAQ57440.1 peptidase family M3 [Pochonia chlamydosporia 170]OWT42320.1 peptidase family M3 [Pochonia chlamydosporia 170]